MGMRDFRQLEVWEVAHHLVLATYKVTADFPKHELYGLTRQMRRCTLHPSGCGRPNGDLHRFLDIAMGSAFELEYFLVLSRDLGLVSDSYDGLNLQTRRVQRMLGSLIRKVEAGRTRN